MPMEIPSGGFHKKPSILSLGNETLLTTVKAKLKHTRLRAERDLSQALQDHYGSIRKNQYVTQGQPGGHGQETITQDAPKLCHLLMMQKTQQQQTTTENIKK